jgi:hypothetical protein
MTYEPRRNTCRPPGKQFAAEVLFLNPDDVPRAVRVLAARGCAFKTDLEAIDECGPTVFGEVTGTTKLSEDELGDWLLDIVDRFGGDVAEWGYVELPVPHRE